MTAVRDTASERHRDKRGPFVQLWRQLPFFVWLDRALDAAVGPVHRGPPSSPGVVAAVVVTRVFRLPPVELSGRVNLWYGAGLRAASSSSRWCAARCTVAWQVLDCRRQPGAAIIAVPLRVDDDLIMTHTAVTASLIPGSLIVDADRDRRILYLHVIGVRSAADVETQRESVLALGARGSCAPSARARRSSASGRMPRPARREVRRDIRSSSPSTSSSRVAALLTLWRIVIGPSILDRAVASDVLLTEVMCVLGAEMAINHHTRIAAGAADHRGGRRLRLDLDRPVRRDEGTTRSNDPRRLSRHRRARPRS